MTTPPSAATDPAPRHICAIGDVHGHLQLGLCVAARWQRELGVEFEAVVLCGDIGSFTADSQLDSATRRHAKANFCELEFMHLWGKDAPHWLARLFEPADCGGLGLTCPVVLVHGNHEGFAHLTQFATRQIPQTTPAISQLPTIDRGGYLHYLPSGWQAVTQRGLVVSGIGGIEAGQRRVRYHDLAYLDEAAIDTIFNRGGADLLVTHQGPAATQGPGGSEFLDPLATSRVAKVWCHGHSTRQPAIQTIRGTQVVPLHDIAFETDRRAPDDPGDDGWALISYRSHGIEIRRERPPFWRDYRRFKWGTNGEGVLVSPDLVPFLWK